MPKKSWTIAKLNLRAMRVPYIVSGIIIACIFIQSIVYLIIALATGKAGNQANPSTGNYLYLVLIIAAIYIPLTHFRRVMNLGGKRDSFFWGCFATYGVLAAGVTLANTLLTYTLELGLKSTGYYIGFNELMQNPALMDTKYVSVTLVDVFGWGARGLFFEIVQQFAFLLLLAVVIHTFTAAQDKWYGWVTDAVLAAILGTFIPIAPLRNLLLGFFYLTIFNENAFLQIAVCLVLSVAIYALNKPIFARKAI